MLAPELMELFVEAVLTNDQNLTNYLADSVEIVTLLDGQLHEGKPATLAVLQRFHDHTERVEEWNILDSGSGESIVRGVFFGHLPSGVLQRFDITWRIVFGGGLIAGIYPYSNYEEAKRAQERAAR